ncbi:TIGR02391 family protein [Nitrospirillum pindoramense]|uniref:Uncharacterized protein (TIGR02391 family) n=1 Tax=Nitrospirillum amazonense TaxID=28077 RepID=A0A560GH52_9PROT|nr:TIGR02391 family protein [Nitrospirillum amazonense]TWB33101.1 uncharacterized protein (TIGR02391 family) [Nitrospirillum amazonense]
MTDGNFSIDTDFALSAEAEKFGSYLIFAFQKIKNIIEYNNRKNPDGWQKYEFSFDVLHILTRNRLTESRNYTENGRNIEYIKAFAEAWSWLIIQGIIVPAVSEYGTSNQIYQFSRAAEKFKEEIDVKTYTLARRLPRDRLHPTIDKAVWSSFIHGDYDCAALQALKKLEVRIRDAAGISVGTTGKSVIEEAFKKDDGKLYDSSGVEAEEHGLKIMLMGIFAYYRNSFAHRDVNLEDPDQAIEIIMMVNHLFRIVEHREKMKP